MREITFKLKIKNFNLSEIRTTQEAIETAKRYIENAKEILNQNISEKRNDNYKDSKLVNKACGILFIAFKLILKGFYLLDQETFKKELQSISAANKSKLDKMLKFYSLTDMIYFGKVLKKLLEKKYPFLIECNKDFTTIYQIIHVENYYEGILRRKVIEDSISLIEEYLEILEQEYNTTAEKK
jgi:hypothetical protein